MNHKLKKKREQETEQLSKKQQIVHLLSVVSCCMLGLAASSFQQLKFNIASSTTLLSWYCAKNSEKKMF